MFTEIVKLMFTTVSPTCACSQLYLRGMLIRRSTSSQPAKQECSPADCSNVPMLRKPERCRVLQKIQQNPRKQPERLVITSTPRSSRTWCRDQLRA